MCLIRALVCRVWGRVVKWKGVRGGLGGEEVEGCPPWWVISQQQTCILIHKGVCSARKNTKGEVWGDVGYVTKEIQFDFGDWTQLANCWPPFFAHRSRQRRLSHIRKREAS